MKNGRGLDCECDFEMIKGEDLRQAENRLTILPLVVAQQEGELDGCSREFVEITRWSFCERKNNCERRQPRTISRY